MKTTRKISEHTAKNKKKISSPSKVRGNPKAKKEEVCFIADVVEKEQLCCCDYACC